MRVVKPGNPELLKIVPLREYPGNCCECTCDFMFDSSDIMIQTRRGLGGRYKDFYICCPTCRVQINVPSHYKDGA